MQKKVHYNQHLIDLKHKLDKNEMSTLVGAGFSKNLDRSFPDWAELIHQMVLFSKEKHLKEAYFRLFPASKSTSKEYQDYLQTEVRNYIERIGPLKVVSDYIRLKGYREAVDFLIEQQTPVIEVSKGKRRLRSRVGGKTTFRQLSDTDIACHAKLVNLPWNNIFTTNYDNLLENCIDINSKTEVEKEIVKLEKKIAKYTSEEKAASLQIKKIQVELENIKDQLIIEVLRFGAGSPEALKVEQNIIKLEVSIHELNQNTKHQHYFLRWDQTRLNNLTDIQKNFRTTVAHSSDLALKKNQNIIKIHGSIRMKSSEPFGFDGDGAKNYVISQQDYDSYGEKHEAFMQLMRITLLQESFCLFGFSGDDPNFLGWITWVRDVLQKKPSDGKVKDKIYLIDVWEHDAEPEKTMFYRNHQIIFIPLGNPDCLAFLEKSTGKKVADDTPKARINLLLDFLSTDVVPGADKISFEVLKQSEYQGVWEGLPLHKLDEDKLKTFLDKTERILSLKTYSRLPSLYGMTDTSQQNFLLVFSTWYKQVADDESLTFKLLQISLLMLQEVYLPASRLFGEYIVEFETMLSVSEQFPDLYDQFVLINLKDAVWANDKIRFEELLVKLKDSNIEEVQQELYYQQALFAFYNYNFASVLHILSAWVPLGHWAMKKSGLLSQISVPGAIDNLRAIEQVTVQETTYKYHILSNLYAANDLRETGEQQYKIVRTIEKGNLKSFHHIIKRILSSLKSKPEKIIPHGHEKFTVITSMFSSESTPDRTGLQLLNLLLETGHPLRLTYVSHLSIEEAYAPLKLAIYWYPEVVLFFTLQYSEEQFLTRIAQDLIYEDRIAEKIPNIARNMMDSYFLKDSPWRYKTSMLVVLSEFINVLDPADWENFYLKVWNDEIKKKFLIDDMRRRRQDFLNKGLVLLTDPNVAEEIIETLLNQFLATEEQQVKDNVIHFLYQFSKNNYLNNLVKGTGPNISKKIFETLISRLRDDVFFLFALGNISFSFSQVQVDKVKDTLSEMKVFDNANPRLWRVILFFGDGDPGIEARVKEAVLKSNVVWRSGINLTKTEYTHFKDVVKLSALREYRTGRNLKWTDMEIKVLFSQMTTELEKIYYWPRYDDQAFEFSDLIKEMRIFLTEEESALRNLPSFIDVKRKVFELYLLDGTIERNLGAILGNDKSKIIKEIEILSDEIYKKNKIEENIDIIETLIYKLLLQKEPALPATLIVIANLFYYKRYEPLLRKFKDRLKLILQMFPAVVIFDIDKPSMEEYFIKIALVLDEWGSEKLVTKGVLDLLENSRFNSIKYNLRSELRVS
jgi:hypothetical protein